MLNQLRIIALRPNKVNVVYNKSHKITEPYSCNITTPLQLPRKAEQTYFVFAPLLQQNGN